MRKIILTLALWSSPVVGFFCLVYPNKYVKIFGLGYLSLGSIIPIHSLEKLPSSNSEKLQKLLGESDKNYQELGYQNALLSQEINQANANLKACKSELATVTDALRYHKDREADYQEKRLSLDDDIRNYELDMQRLEILEQKLELEKFNYQNQLDKQQIQQQYTLEKSSDKIAELQQTVRDLSTVNQQLNQQIQILKAENAKPQDKVAAIIFELFTAKNKPVEYVKSSNVAGVVSHCFKPLCLDYLAVLSEIANELPGLSETISTPPTYSVGMGQVKFTFDDRTPLDRISFAPKNWLEELSRSDENLLILGARGTGKSELMMNYLKCLYTAYPDDFKAIFCQPKPDGFSNLVLPDGSKITPKYVGFEDCLEAVYGLNERVLQRNKKRELHYKRTQETLEFDPEFWIIDEFQQLIFQAENFGYKPADISVAIKNCVSLGRALEIYVVCLGQIPNVSQFPKWNKADFYQFNQCYLGDAAKVGIDYVAATNEENKSLKSEFSTISKSGNKYFGLVRNSGKNQWCFLPKPASTTSTTQAPQAPQPESLEAIPVKDSNEWCLGTKHQAPRQNPDIQCPHCGGLNISKKGKRGGKSRYQCGECGKNFSQ